MSSKMQEFYIDSSVGPIHCCQWLPDGACKGVFQIIHGIQEYVARYDHFASFLADHGYIVVGADHPGHGKSVSNESALGYLSGGWKEAVSIIHRLHKKVHGENPKLPYIMFGHSMGSFLLTTYLSVCQDEIDAAIISGTGWQPKALLTAGQLLCNAENRRLGEKQCSTLLLKMMFGPYNKPFMPADTPYEWICSDKNVVDIYAADPLCTWKPTVQLCSQMLNGIRKNQNQKNLSRIAKDLPLFFIAGQKDPVGNFGNGVLRAVEAFKLAGIEDILVELYPDMRHECHNEVGKEKVYYDILAWIETKSLSTQGKGCNL